MTGLFHAHSGLRFLVLLAAVIALAWYLFGMVTKRPVDKSVRILGSIYVGVLDLQILLGLGLVAMYVTGGRWYPALIGHIVMMVLAAAVAHVLLAKNRKSATPGYKLPLIAVVVSLLLVVGGIMAVPGRGLFTMTPMG